MGEEFYINILWGLWVVLAPIFSFLFIWVFKRLNNVYTKEEAKELMDLKIDPLVKSLDRHSGLIEKQTQVLEKLNDSLQLLHIDMSIVKVKVESLEASSNAKVTHPAVD